MSAAAPPPPASLRARIRVLNQSVRHQTPFSSEELDSVCASLRAVLPLDCAWHIPAIRDLLARHAHLSHKDWDATEAAAAALGSLISGPGDASFDSAFERVLVDGNWSSAANTASARTDGDAKPWAVLVTGVNGIRKTTSVYEPWFCEALGAGVEGPSAGSGGLPGGQNSFFRQLDFLVATVASEQFASMYRVEDVAEYAALKDAVFARHRTVAEIVGALLVRRARDSGMNVMVETSGRDVGMFKYIEHFFGGRGYRLMVVHFSVDDVRGAEESVRRRMEGEMIAGRKARGAREVIAANAGGPYGPEVLRRVQKESDEVWEAVRSGTAVVGKGWWKARLSVRAPLEGDWTVAAGEGDKEQLFHFSPRTLV